MVACWATGKNKWLKCGVNSELPWLVIGDRAAEKTDHLWAKILKFLFNIYLVLTQAKCLHCLIQAKLHFKEMTLLVAYLTRQIPAERVNRSINDQQVPNEKD